MHLHTQREFARIPRLYYSHTNDALTQHFPLLIIDLNKHRILPRSLAARMSNDTIHTQRKHHRLRGSL